MSLLGGTTWSARVDLPLEKSANMLFLTTRCQYQGGRSANWSANMSSNSRNVKLPFLTTRCHYWGDIPVDLPLDLPIWAVTVEMWNCYSWPLDATTGGRSARSATWYWALTVEMWNCYSWPLDATTGGKSGVDLATWSANMSSNSRNVKLLFLTTRCHYWGVDLPVDLPAWSANMSSNSRNVKLPFWTIDVSTRSATVRTATYVLYQ